MKTLEEKLEERLSDEMLYLKLNVTPQSILEHYLNIAAEENKPIKFNKHLFRKAIVRYYNQNPWEWTEFVDYFLSDLSDDDPTLEYYEDVNAFADALYNALRLGNVDITAFCNIEAFYKDWYTNHMSN